MNINKQVVASTLVIMGVGIANAWTNNQGITSVVLGGYVFMLVLSIIDLFGGGAATVASALSLLAVVAALLLEGLPILQHLGGGQFLQTGATVPTAPAQTPSTTPGTQPAQ